LPDVLDDTIQSAAAKLGVRCGLRTHEIIGVTPQDMAETDASAMLRVWESAKTDHYRETPIPPEFATTIDGVRDDPSDAPLVDVSKRSLRRWMEDATEQL
jgi:hypothetical protein